MVRTIGRLDWLLAALLGGCLLNAGPCRAQDEDDAATLRAAVARGDTLRKAGKWKEAAASYEAALELAPEVYGANDLGTANILNSLGFVYDNLAQYDKAEPCFQRSLQIAEDKLGKNHLNVAQILHNLAFVYDLQGEYAKSEPLYLRSLKIREDKVGKNDPLVAQSLNNLALLYQKMGQYAKAEPLYLRSLQINEENLGKNDPAVAVCLTNLGRLYRETGEYAKAEPLLQRGVQIQEDSHGKDDPSVAVSLTGLAVLYRSMGQYDKAEPLFLRSLEIQEAVPIKNNPDVAANLTNLADLYRVMRKYDKAEPLYQRGLQIREDKLGKDHPDVANSLNGLGCLYCDTGRYDEAKTAYQRALEIREARLPKDHPNVANSLNSLAALYDDMGQYAKAEPLFLRSLKIAEDKLGEDHPDVATCLNNLTRVYAAEGRWKEAADAADRERRIIRRHVARVLPLLSEKEQLAFVQHRDVENFNTVESLALARRGDAATTALAASWVLNGKAVAHEALAQRALLALDAKDPAAADLNQQLLSVRSQRTTLRQTATRPGLEDERRKELDDLAAEEKDLAERLAKIGSRSLRVEPWVELAEVRKALAADAVLIEVSRYQVYEFEGKDKTKPWGAYCYAAWVIAAEGDVQVIDLGPADAIDDAVKAVRQALKDAQGSRQHPSAITQDGEPDAEKALLKPLRELSMLVLGPLSEQIDGKRRWYVSPDADLWLVPWAALPLKDGRYAVEAHTISYLVSGRDLVAPASQAKPSRPRMMADPDYDLGVDAARAAAKELHAKPDESDPGLTLRGLPPGLTLGKAPRLPGTSAEAKAIKPALEKYAGEEAWLYQRDQALEGAFKMFHGPRVLVLSTHGFFLPDQDAAVSEKPGLQDNKGPALDKEGKPLENPLLRCGLLLAGCNNRDQIKEGDEDGVLTGLEVVGTDLRGTELVVLSACETGLGDVHNGEGVAGLRQAFQLAGARSVAATLWQVPDRESAKLMGDFFVNLADAKDKAEALRQAQLAMIQARRDKNAAAHPFFWAAYTLTGQ